MIRVVLVDDQPLVREGLRALPDRAEDITVVGEAADASAGMALVCREREVPAEVGTGRSDGEIAERLFISAATARTHVGRLLAELGARDRAQPVVIAYETGLVSAGRS